MSKIKESRKELGRGQLDSLLNKEEALCVLVKSCRVTLLLSFPQLFLIFSSLQPFSFTLFLFHLPPQLFSLFLAVCPFPPLPDLPRWDGHVPAARVVLATSLRASHTHEGRLRAAHFPLRGAKGHH